MLCDIYTNSNHFQFTCNHTLIQHTSAIPLKLEHSLLILTLFLQMTCLYLEYFPDVWNQEAQALPHSPLLTSCLTWVTQLLQAPFP